MLGKFGTPFLTLLEVRDCPFVALLSYKAHKTDLVLLEEHRSSYRAKSNEQKFVVTVLCLSQLDSEAFLRPFRSGSASYLRR